MWIGLNVFRFIERALLLSGLLLLITFSLAHVHRFVLFRAEMERFEREQSQPTEVRPKEQPLADVQNNVGGPSQTLKTDYSLWSVQRIKLYQSSLGMSPRRLIP